MQKRSCSGLKPLSWLERPRKERLTLAGDAAHRTLPYGGWGLNSGIHSAHNLAWQLGAVNAARCGTHCSTPMTASGATLVN
jgi:2-polyprenyl-6-methoxyphenol hydroxylase-like FAD-dependent oxidoreductase